MKVTKILFLSLATALFGLSASAEGNFVPVPTNEEAPLRLFVGADANNAWQPLQLDHLQGAASVVYGVGSGLDVGFALHGGAANKLGLFQAGHAYNGIVGGDVMLRFLGNVTEMFFMGVQATAGYDYDFSAANLTAGSKIPVSVGLALGFSFVDAVNLYVFPQFNFGAKATTDIDKLWGSQIGMGVAVGTWINLGGTNLVIEAKPEWVEVQKFADFTTTNFKTNWLVGLAWDL